jgi:outer membrane protein insertion porin family/translocation and assembly module TamA
MHFPRRLGRAALAMVVGAAVAPTLGAQDSRGDISPTPEVRKLEFHGVSDAIDLEDLKAHIYTTATKCRSVLLAPICAFSNYRGFEERHYLDHRELERDVLRIKVYYYRKGYREAQVDTTVTPVNEKEVAVRFDIEEGAPTLLTSVDIVYDSTLLSPKKVKSLSLLKVGEPLDLFEMDTMRVNFQNALWELGYADALVDSSSVVQDEANTAQVQFRLVANHLTTISNIVVTGLDEISPKTVLNLLTFRQGDLYRRSTVLESQRSLYESNLFKLAAIDVPQSFDTAKTVNVVLREAQLHEARVSAGFNTVDYVQTEGRFTHYNLLGGARRLDVTGTVGNLFARSLNGKGIFHRQNPDTTISGSGADFLQPTWQTSITLTQPAFIRARNTLALSAFAQRRSLPAVFIDRGYGGDVTFTRPVGVRAPLSLNYRFEVTRVEANPPYFCVNFGVCDTTTISALLGHQRLSPVLLQLQVDRSDQPLNPTTGYRASGQVEHASRLTVSDFAYNRFYGDGSLYHTMGGTGNRRSVLAFHLRLGFVRPMTGPRGDDVLHPRKRFYAGGAQSVRGYGENQLGPRILTLPHGYLIHAEDVRGGPCDFTSEQIRFCDPNTARDSVDKDNDGVFDIVGPDKFTPRPLGGTSLLEGSVEYRFPLPLIQNLQGAMFLDGAVLGERVLNPLEGVNTLANLVHGTGAITPGFGIRYLSPVGPIRIDLGFNPSRAEKLAVVTELEENGKRVIIPLETPRLYSATGSGAGGFRGFLNRLTLHFSIGQAY